VTVKVKGRVTGSRRSGASKPREGRLSELVAVSRRRRGRDYWVHALLAIVELLEHVEGTGRVCDAVVHSVKRVKVAVSLCRCDAPIL
jgi:hypothetical protein